jgi:5-methylcytosine-specific restriction endonuclease McrA
LSAAPVRKADATESSLAASAAHVSGPTGAQQSFALRPKEIASGPDTRPAPPVADDRFLLRVTISRETNAKLERARDLLRHSIPNGDPAEILDRALTIFVAHLERTKLAATTRPRTPSTPARRNGGTTRHVPAPVKRAVWARDGGRCTFVGAEGRCAETGRLEFHHVEPYARGGPTDVANLTLRCRAHNAYDARLVFGDRVPGAAAAAGARSGPS